jgi:hypothetical protein
MELPAPDPVTLLASWMEWEHGNIAPGKVLSDLKRAGMRELLEDLARHVTAQPE